MNNNFLSCECGACETGRINIVFLIIIRFYDEFQIFPFLYLESMLDELNQNQLFDSRSI